MLFYLDESLNSYKNGNLKLIEKVIDGFDNLATSRREGKHQLLGDISVLRYLSNFEPLSKKSKGIYNFLSTNFSTTSGLQHQIDCYLRIVDHSKPFIVNTNGSKRIIQVPISHFSDTETIQKTILLSENEIDAQIYESIGRTSAFECNIGNIVLRLDPIGGGGANTAAKYDQIQKANKRLCLCIVDSDKEFPEDSVKNTASAVLKVDDINRPLTFLKVLEVREAENLIPVMGFSVSCNGDPNKSPVIASLSNIEKSDIAESRLFLDLKKNIRIKDFHDIENLEFQDYWLDKIPSICEAYDIYCSNCKPHIECSNPVSCECISKCSLGEKILSEVADSFSKMSNQKLSEIKSSSIVTSSYWDEIGRLVLEWCIGSRPRST